MARNIVYILPINTMIASSEWGWEFTGSNSIPGVLLKKILVAFEVELTANYLAIEKYTNQAIDMNVVFEDSKIKEICIRTRGPLAEVMNKLNLFIKDFDVEIFLPPTEHLDTEKSGV